MPLYVGSSPSSPISPVSLGSPVRTEESSRSIVESLDSQSIGLTHTRRESRLLSRLNHYVIKGNTSMTLRKHLITLI